MSLEKQKKCDRQIDGQLNSQTVEKCFKQTEGQKDDGKVIPVHQLAYTRDTRKFTKSSVWESTS